MPPQESPANRHINEGAGDAGGILLGFASGLVVQSTRASSPDHRGAFQAALNAFVAEERTLEDLGGLTGSTSRQSGLYPHRGQADRASLEPPGVESPDYPPPPTDSFRRSKGWGCGGIFPIRLGQPRRRSSLGRDELLQGGATQKYPVILDGLLSNFEMELTVSFPVWHLGRNLLARHLACGFSNGLLVKALGLSLLLAARHPDSLAVGGSVLGLQEWLKEVKRYGQDDGRALLRGDLPHRLKQPKLQRRRALQTVSGLPEAL